MNFGGFELIPSEFMTVSGEPVQVRRSWRQRLFARPWKPWAATVTVIPRLPAPGVIQVTANRLVAHPATIRAMVERLGEIERARPKGTP